MQCDCSLHQWQPNHLGLHPTSFGPYHWEAYEPLMLFYSLCQRSALGRSTTHCFERGCLLLLKLLSTKPFMQYGGKDSFGDSAVTHNLCLPYMVKRGPFAGLIPFGNAAGSTSVIGSKSDGTRMVIQYQVNKFTCA